ncbi:DEAD/DEAH box helicase [Psittacicella gerlachiana]|nr:DEAD/DEAH box helicase [Psittacicella gerlachiana]
MTDINENKNLDVLSSLLHQAQEQASKKVEAKEEQAKEEQAKHKKKKFKSPKLDKRLIQLVAEKKELKEQEKAKRQGQDETKQLFVNYDLPKRLEENLAKNNFTRATNIQAQAIEAINEGHDILISAETGTGKTLAYLIPALDAIFYPKTSRPSKKCKVLVVAPSHDLATQIYNLALKLFEKTFYNAYAFIGEKKGLSRELNAQETLEVFDNHELVITTPGRLANQLLENPDLDLSEVSFLVLDEADRLLEMGMMDDIKVINEALNPNITRILASATLNNNVESLFNTIALNKPLIIQGSHSRSEKNTLTQYYYHADNIEHKKKLLISLLSELKLERIIVFVNKIDSVQPLVKFIMNQKMGLRATGISGELSKEERERALGLFKSGKVNILVTTDLLARGIDIENVQAVFNYDLPYDGATFVHRVGRTGRLGKRGLAISLVQAHEYQFLGKAMRFMKVIIPAKVYPGLEPTTSVSADALKGKKKLKLKDKSKNQKKADKPKVKVRARDKKNKGFPKKFQ